jgi:hypothetical protein
VSFTASSSDWVGGYACTVSAVCDAANRSDDDDVPLVGGPPRRLERRGDFAPYDDAISAVLRASQELEHALVIANLRSTLRMKQWSPDGARPAALVSCPRTRASRIPRRWRNFGCLLPSPVATLAPPRRVPLDTRFRGYDRGLTGTSCSCFLSAQRSNPGAAPRGPGLLRRVASRNDDSDRSHGPTQGSPHPRSHLR